MAKKMDMAEARRRIAVVHQTGRTSLDLSGLGLTALPPEIAALTALQRLYLDGNPLHRTHFDALEHGISNLFAFVHRLAGDATPL